MSEPMCEPCRIEGKPNQKAHYMAEPSRKIPPRCFNHRTWMPQNAKPQMPAAPAKSPSSAAPANGKKTYEYECLECAFATDDLVLAVKHNDSVEIGHTAWRANAVERDRPRGNEPARMPAERPRNENSRVVMKAPGQADNQRGGMRRCACSPTCDKEVRAPKRYFRGHRPIPDGFTTPDDEVAEPKAPASQMSNTSEMQEMSVDEYFRKYERRNFAIHSIYEAIVTRLEAMADGRVLVVPPPVKLSAEKFGDRFRCYFRVRQSRYAYTLTLTTDKKHNHIAITKKAKAGTPPPAAKARCAQGGGGSVAEGVDGSRTAAAVQ